MKLTISAAFTAEPLERILQFWSTELGIPIPVEFAPYNQLSQTLLDPASIFALNTDGVNVLLLRADDLLAENPVEHARELVGQIQSTSNQRTAPLLVCICPASPAFSGDRALVVEEFRQGLSGVPGVLLVAPDEIADLYPVSEWYSEQGDRIGKLPYTEPFYAALATTILRRSLALIQSRYKVIVLDCDNTLWHGVCGEDGPSGVTIEPPRRAMQEFFKTRRGDGMLLAIASKNNPEDVAETFRQNPGMPLHLDDFSAVRVNWSPKSENLRSLAEELNLGLDSFIFVDDDPKECAEIQEVLPEVLTIPLPHDVDSIPRFIRNLWAFDRGIVTEADQKRSDSYKSVREFSQALHASESHETFMASLNLNIQIHPLAENKISRTAQLTQRTNQFNNTTIRRNEAEIQAIGADRCWTIDVSDRFGDYGQTGIVIFKQDNDALEVESFMLSCRVLGRGVEHQVLSQIAQEAIDSNLPWVSIPFEQSARNQPIEEFLKQAAEQCSVTAQAPFQFPSEKLRTLTWKPRAATQRESMPVEQKKNAKPLPYVRIARTLTSAERIVQAARAGAGFDYHRHADLSETERRVARIWSEILQVPSVAANDNFFDLGGHSLLVVLLQMRVREVFGVELDVDDVYSGTLTLSGLADKIEMKQIGELTPQEYRALVAEIEALSDQEVQELLAQEGRN